MPTPLPISHVHDALKLQEADAIIHLFEMSPLSGGTVYFKNDDPVEWRGNLYEGLPCVMSGEEFDTDKTPQPRLVIGQEDLDLLPFKGLVHDGHLEGATLVRKKVLLSNLLANANIRQLDTYRVKRVSDYGRTSITLELASFSTAINQTIPFRQYLPPAFPWVDF